MPRLIPIDYRKLAKVFEKKGFVYVRTQGDHLVYQKAGLLRPIIIPKYKEIPENLKHYVLFYIFPVKDITKRNRVIRELFGRKEKSFVKLFIGLHPE